ncbi:coiled-coil domain-containing protein 42 homolog [Harmonia axyridis]|uniref:coiled-coil domain-containing protein 42 homolog n=1 Tax=Harmonia axyridis TaxID=115357 RepID=UPI001E27693C|nr:coiled-coil domain-containing protein 42 homolog [Harmonia axyridis]
MGNKMDEKHHYQSDVRVQNFSILRSPYTNRYQLAKPQTDFHREYEDLFAFFPKTYQSVKELKLFQVNSYDFTEVLDRRLGLQKEKQQGYSLMMRKMNMRESINGIKYSLKEQWKELEKKEYELKKYLISFREFLILGNERIERLQSKIYEFRKLRESREDQVDFLLEQKSRLRKVLEDIRKNIQLLVVYENFLQLVVKSRMSQFESIDEMMNHFEILIERKAILVDKATHTSQKVLSSIREMMDLQRVAETEIQNLKMQVYDLEQKYIAAKNKAIHKQNFYIYIMDKMKQKRQEFLTCREAIFSIYMMMSKTLIWDRENLCSKDDFLGQLSFMSMVMSCQEKITRKKICR